MKSPLDPQTYEEYVAWRKQLLTEKYGEEGVGWSTNNYGEARRIVRIDMKGYQSREQRRLESIEALEFIFNDMLTLMKKRLFKASKRRSGYTISMKFDDAVKHIISEFEKELEE